MFLIKFFCYFVFSFAILCISVGNKPLFSHLHKITSPYSRSIMSSLKDAAIKGLKKGKNIISNTIPKEVDSVNSTYSAIRKSKYMKVDNDIPEDQYTSEERDLLEKILKENQ
ncbi:MAG: hypothetical protein KAQ98_00350 [Bacteriovoracaceae bacterium]|nr:hypothetical protein [Bacteriovoracaceae bacterium]